MALWMERSKNDEVTLRIAGPREERLKLRNLYKEMVRILEIVADKVHITRVGVDVGILPPCCQGGDKMMWWSENDVQKCKASGKRVMTCEKNGKAYTFPLYLIDPNARDDEVLPNFDSLQLIPRVTNDPEFVLHQSGCASDTPRTHQSEVEDIVEAIMEGYWGQSWAYRKFCKWETKMNWEQTRKRIQVVDVTQYGEECDMHNVAYQLYVCLPMRNLYVPIESFHTMAVHQFCNEVLRLLRALGAKHAAVKNVVNAEKKRSRIGEVGIGDGVLGGSATNEGKTHISVDLKEDFPNPTGGPNCPYFLDAEPWFFLAKRTGAPRTVFYGLNFTAAIAAVAEVEKGRVDDGASKESFKLKITNSAARELKLYAR
ncbi:MAG: hypothetical protein AAGJ35_12705, partial [Myxococcota bacterium]